MDVLFWVFILIYLDNSFCNEDANSDYLNTSIISTNESFIDLNGSFNFSDWAESSTVSLPMSTETLPAEANTMFPDQTTETVTDEHLATDASTTESTRSATSPQPLPLSGSLPSPASDVSSLCPCDLQSEQCDLNCCCDTDCTEELALFTTCSIGKVVGDPRFCSQDAAVYTLSLTPDGLARVQSSVNREINPDVFCIQSANYKAGLSYATPKVPTEGNFDDLFRRFAEFFFSRPLDSSTSLAAKRGIPTGYLYGDAIQTEDETGGRKFFRLPAPAGTAHCSDANPAAFLKDQTTRCMRNLDLARDCNILGALNLQTYTSLTILSGRNKDASGPTLQGLVGLESGTLKLHYEGNIIHSRNQEAVCIHYWPVDHLQGVEVAAISLQSLEGTQSQLDPADGPLYDPVLLGPPAADSIVCNNLVLQVRYMVTYSEAGEIVNVTASLVLGAINSSMVPVEQEFQIAFVQENTGEALVHSSGNPGYVVGLPLVAGSRTTDGIVQSTDPRGTLTVLHSSRDQDCLLGSSQRSPVLFGVDTVSGCTLRLEEAANCSLVSEVLLWVLKGQSSPEYVASFGNSPPQNPMDWVSIRNPTTPTGTQSCSIPLSYHLEVRWTKYGSLVNPQAQILSVMETIHTNASSLLSLSGGGSVLSVTSSVSFIDMSAAAHPGYKVLPTFNAKLPYDFFFPFV